MSADRPWGLLRSAGLPIRLWLAAANPELFDRVRSVVELEDRYAAAAALVADELGAVLVPHRAVEPATRRVALACRRRLHRGGFGGPDVQRLADRAVTLGLDHLADRLANIARMAERLGTDSASLELAVAAEHDRLLAESWRVLNDSPVGRWALADGTITVGADVDRRLRDGAAWRGKRLRQRSDYLWRMIARGTVKTTPRSWLGHASLVTFGAPAGEFVDLGAAVAIRTTGNVHAGRSERAATVQLSDADPISLAPLHRRVDGHLEVWVVRADRPDRLRPVRMRLTPPLAAVLTTLSCGARSVGDIVAELLPADSVATGRPAVRKFVGHLVEIGVCQVSPLPVVRRTGWRAAGPDAPVVGDANGFRDVYRRPCGSWPADALDRVARGLAVAQRISAIIDADQDDAADPLPEIGETPRPVLDVFAERLAALPDLVPEQLGDGPAKPVWPSPRRPDSAYARLVRWLSAAADRSAATVDISAELLDRIGAPDARCSWPVDCLVRPLRSGGLVLDGISAAGVLDARFNAEFEALHGPLSQQEEHRELVRRLDAATGVRSVELLVPPLSDRAANAVRRPLYPTAWTGDPDLGAYCTTDPRDAEYLPLSDLTVRRAGGATVIEAAGTPVRLFYHATRVPPPPWDLLIKILTRTDNRIAARFRRLRHSLPALPDRTAMPRLTLDGGAVIVTPAQWRLDPDELWDARDSELAKIRRLVRLRARLGLPRWVMVCAGPGARPVGCDLDSLRALSTLEFVAAHNAGGERDSTERWILLEEMVPDPTELVVRDTLAGTAEPVAAELMIRFPQHIDPATMAGRAARALAGESAAWPPRDRTRAA